MDVISFLHSESQPARLKRKSVRKGLSSSDRGEYSLAASDLSAGTFISVPQFSEEAIGSGRENESSPFFRHRKKKLP